MSCLQLSIGFFLLCLGVLAGGMLEDSFSSHEYLTPTDCVKFLPAQPEFHLSVPKGNIERTTFVMTGHVSYYSHDGCVGCNPEQIMANGDPFDEDAMTLAFNRLPLNTRVKVTNLDTGVSTVATVTDTGGFEKLNRIADLSKGLADVLGAKTDSSLIEIREVIL